MADLKNINMLTNWEITTGDIFDDLFEAGEAASLKMRSDLMMSLRNEIKASGMAQLEAAKLMKVTQPRVSDLLRGKINDFTIDMLIMMAVRLGLSVSWKIKSKSVRTISKAKPISKSVSNKKQKIKSV